VWEQTPNLNNGECVARSTYEEALQFRSNQPYTQKPPSTRESRPPGLANGTPSILGRCTLEVGEPNGTPSILGRCTLEVGEPALEC
jgi:hypothetical protein